MAQRVVVSRGILEEREIKRGVEQQRAVLAVDQIYRRLLGAIGVWLPGLTRLTGICLIVMLIAFLPANIYSALHHVDFGGHGSGPIYLLVRVPFQLLVAGWTYWATEQRWFDKLAPARIDV